MRTESGHTVWLGQHEKASIDRRGASCPKQRRVRFKKANVLQLDRCIKRLTHDALALAGIVTARACAKGLAGSLAPAKQAPLEEVHLGSSGHKALPTDKVCTGLSCEKCSLFRRRSPGCLSAFLKSTSTAHK